jgi:hypothetical protein
VFVDAVRVYLSRLVAEPPELAASTVGRQAALVGAVSMSLRFIHESLAPEISECVQWRAVQSAPGD